MKLYTVCVVLAIAVAAQAKTSEKEKRGAESYVTTSSPVYATGATLSSVYSTKGLSQQQQHQQQQQQQQQQQHLQQQLQQLQQQQFLANKVNYISAQPSSYEQQQITVQQPVKVTYAAQPAYTSQHALAAQQAFNAKFASAPVQYVQPQQHASYVFEAQQQAQPGLKYSAAQPDFKYVLAQQAASKAASVSANPSKIAYSSPVNVQYAAQPVATQQHYSPANSVSSFSFSNPHVTYSNLGLLSQVAGKGYTGQQQQLHQQTVSQSAGPQQVAYVAAPAPAATHYVSAGAAQQVSHAPAPQIQYSAAPQVQYVQAPQQVQFAAAAGPQYQFSAHQGSHSSPQYVYAAPQVSYAGGAAPTKTHYATSGVTYA